MMAQPVVFRSVLPCLAMRAPPVASFLLATSAACALGLACQSNPSGPSGPSSTCPLPSGMFTETFSTVDSGAACPPQPDETLTLNGSESFLEPAMGSEIPGGVTDCATDVDTATCTYSASCTTTVDSGTAQIVLTSVTFDGDTAHGRRTVAANSCDTNVCVYAVTITRN